MTRREVIEAVADAIRRRFALPADRAQTPNPVGGVDPFEVERFVRSLADDAIIGHGLIGDCLSEEELG